jgi:probable O-glycosylation ligase (exosortase A-associated)
MIFRLLTYALTAFGAVAGIFSPFQGLLACICLSVIRPWGLWPDAVPPGNYTRIVAIAVLVGWLLKSLGSWRFGRAKWIFISLLAYWAWMVICAFQAPDQEAAWSVIEGQSKILIPVAIGLTLVESRKQLLQLAWVLIISQTTIALAAHFSFYVAHTGNWIGNQGMGGYDNNDLAAGMVLICGLAFGLGLAETVAWRKWLALTCAALCVHATLMSYSRGGMLGVIMCGVATVILVMRERRHYKIVAIAILVALTLAGPPIRERFSTIFEAGKDTRADHSAENRVEYWKKGMEVMRENPIFGLGPGGFIVRRSEDGRAKLSAKGKGQVAHSLWIQTGTEQGFPGLLLLIGMYAITMLELVRLFRKPPPEEPWYGDAARMALIGLPGFLVCASFLSIANLEQAYFMILFAGGTVKLYDSAKNTVLAETNPDCGQTAVLSPDLHDMPISRFLPIRRP